jgi:hypothetical protein
MTPRRGRISVQNLVKALIYRSRHSFAITLGRHVAESLDAARTAHIKRRLRIQALSDAFLHTGFKYHAQQDAAALARGEVGVGVALSEVLGWRGWVAAGIVGGGELRAGTACRDCGV